MRVGIVYETTFPEFKGGVERWFAELSDHLARQSLEVQYFNTSNKTGSSRGVRFVSLGGKTNSFHMTGMRSSHNALSFAMSVFKGLRNNEVEIVYLSAFPFFHIWASKIVQRVFRKKYKIYVEWFELPNLKFWINEFGVLMGIVGYLTQQLSVRLSDVNVAYLESTAGEIDQLRTKHQITLKLPGICMEEYDEKIPTSNVEKNSICQIGRLTADKQPILSLIAIKMLRDSGWTGHFNLIGSGPMEKKIFDFVIENDMFTYVSIHVDASDDLREEILKKSAALLHPSKREGFGLAVVEAASLGVPAILIRNSNNKSTELGINPMLIAESDEPQELVNLLQKVLKNQKKYSEECLRWNIQERSNMLARDSINELVKHFKILQSQNEK